MEMFTFMMNSDDFVTHESRCLYESSEAMVTHGVMSFPDGTREAVLAFHEIKDGQVIRWRLVQLFFLKKEFSLSKKGAF